MSTPAADRDALAELLAKQALHELITGYSRAVDRLDEAAFVALFHPEAIVDSGVLRDTPARFAAAFSDWVRTRGRLIFHAVTNEWFQIDGERAIGESYLVAVSRLRAATGEQDVLTVGRYFDRFERRAAGWRFLERRFVLDHSVTLTDGLPPLPEPAGPSEHRGTFGPADPIYRFWKAR